jgi:DNA-binding beta-propeller fold protein YncE
VLIERIGDPATGGTVALGKVAGRTVAFLADEDGTAIRAVDTATMLEVASVPLKGRPSQLLVTRQGQLWVTLRDEASVAVLAAHADRTLTETARFAAATEPVALAPAAGNDAVFVASGWGHALERFDATTFERSLTVDLPREPRAVIASRDGSTAYVAHAGTGGISAVHLADRTVANIDLGNPAVSFMGKSSVMPEPPFGDGLDAPHPHPHPRRRTPKAEIPETFARQGFALARITLASTKGDLERIVAPHAEMITGDPKVISSGYGGGGIEGLELPTEQFGISTLDDAAGKRMAARDVELSTVHPCRLPRAAATADDKVLVACLGGGEIAAYTVADGTRFVRAVHVPAGPTGLAFDPETKNVYTFSLFDATLTELGVSAFAAPPKNVKDEQQTPPSRAFRIDRPSPLGEVAERGRRIFHAGGDPRISKDGRACASCHPDGRDDGLVWSTPNGPRQTILLAGRVRHEGPFGWMAKHATLQEHMRSTMKNLKGKGLDPSDEDALASYLVTMPGPPALARALSAEEERGRALFESKETECSQCHGGTDRSDHEAHDVKSASATDTTHDLLAPSLAGIGGSAPYFHDGRYSSLEQLLDKSEGKMATVAGLSPGDKGALVAYLQTL